MSSRSWTSLTPSTNAANATISTASTSRQLVPSTGPPAKSLLNQSILSEDDYTTGLSDIIMRDFYPQLRELNAQNNMIRAFESEDPIAIQASIQRMRECVTPTPRRRNRGATPGSTPFSNSGRSMYDDTPTHFDATPSTSAPSSSRLHSQTESLPYDPNLSLTAFQSTYTSSDNASFATLLQSDNLARREKHKWAWDAQAKANRKAIAGREARERLVEMTKRMVEKYGAVRMIEGGAGRPGDRRMVLDQSILLEGEGGREERGMIESSGPSNSSSTLLIENGAKGKGKEIVLVKNGKGADYVDYDQFDEEATSHDDPALLDQQAPVELWPFTNRNAFMFGPDADVVSDKPLLPDVDPNAFPLGEPKAIRYHATRLEQVSKGGSGRGGKSSSSNGNSSSIGGISPSRSRINAAITGTPYPVSATPKVSGFSFVSALPSPRASTIPAVALQELMTWGTIDSTPIALRSSAGAKRSALSEGGGPFKIPDVSRRERLALRMAGKSSQKGLGRAATPGSIARTATMMQQTAVASPRNEFLSPAAKELLGRTARMSNGKGMGLTLMRSERSTVNEMDERRKRAREMESRELLKRSRWSESPAMSLGFDPNE